MGKAEIASRNKTFLALRIAGKRFGRNSSNLFFALLAMLFMMNSCGRLIPVWAQMHAATYRKHAMALLNDVKVTPGKVRTSDAKEVCSTTTPQFRNTTEKMKNQVYTWYGVDKHKLLAGTKASAVDAKRPLYEIDHLISLELGGADDIANLWPQPYYEHPGAHEKDAVENWLHKQVCEGKMDLAIAQAEIATDWYQVYLKMKSEGPSGAQ